MKKKLNYDEFELLLLDQLNDMQDFILCPMDICDTVKNFVYYYVEQEIDIEVNKRLDELDNTVNNIKI